MKKHCWSVLAIALWSVTFLVAADDKPNQLTAEEKKAGFELIFDGSDLDGWEHKKNWTIEDGALTRKDRGGDITYKAKKIPDDFELRFEWKVAKGSNSGV